MTEESSMDIARIIGGLARAAIWTAKALMLLAATPLLAVLFFVLVIWAFYVGVRYFLQGWYLGRPKTGQARTAIPYSERGPPSLAAGANQGG